MHYERPPKESKTSTIESLEDAARRLDLQPNALRARCRRNAREVGDSIVAKLGAGITAFKLGRSWRVRFPVAFDAATRDDLI